MGAADDMKVPLQISRNCVVASIQVDLSFGVLSRFRTDLLEALQSSGAVGVILDLSGVTVLDRHEFAALQRTMDMARLMGARSIVAGVNAGVVSSLVELGVETDGIEAALDLDHAFTMMESAPSQNDEDGEDEPAGPPTAS
jgi:rsbT antagonist protein RsbS